MAEYVVIDELPPSNKSIKDTLTRVLDTYQNSVQLQMPMVMVQVGDLRILLAATGAFLARGK